MVCQGLKSCIEPPRLGEPGVLVLNLTPPKSKISQVPSPFPQKENQENFHDAEKKDDDNNGDCNKNNNGELGGWSFIQALTQKSSTYKEVEKEKVYVHPLDKRFSSSLSSKSLEMCTESLGCETGSDISGNSSDDDFSFSSHSWEIKKIQKPTFRVIRGAGGSGSFPPPLTSISRSKGVQVRPHREGGRLVIQAVAVSSCSGYFQADRANGRLRLSLLKECSINCQSGIINSSKEGDEVVEDEIDSEEEEMEEKEVEVEEDSNEEEEEEEETEYHDNYDEDEGFLVEDMDGNIGNVGCKIGIAEVTRQSRCKEGGSGNKGMSSWGPFISVPIS